MGIKKLDDCLVPGKTLPFPFLMLVIDEIAELTMLKDETGERKELKAECRELIRSLASLGRAAGVYMAVATQYPTAEVIASNIKINLDVRFGYMVVTGVESRVILDTTGAEKLQKPGECVFKHNRYLLKIDTPKIDDAEIIKAVSNAIAIDKAERRVVEFRTAKVQQPVSAVA
jgi:S-DNA-T family DNA segregation ATPase FtsK/SpoIIIE